MLEFKSWEWRERARERIAAKVAEFMASPDGQRFLNRQAMNDDPFRQIPPDAVTPSRIRAAILHAIENPTNDPDGLDRLEVELAKNRLTVTWDERTYQMTIGWAARVGEGASV